MQSFGRSGATAGDERKLLVSAAIDLMHVLGNASTALARLPASPSVDGVNAGMSFTMLRGVEPLLPGAVERALLTERARDLAATDVGLGDAAARALGRAVASLTGWSGPARPGHGPAHGHAR